MMIDYMTWFWLKHIVTNYSRYTLGQQSLFTTIYAHWSCMWFFWYIILLPILIIATAFLTYHERSIIADIQFRKGPRKIGAAGLLQPIADALKLLAKEHINVRFVHEYLFHIAAILSFAISMFFWFIVPLAAELLVCNTEYSVVWLINLSIFHIYTIIIAGWASYSKYADLGALRTTAQLVSYEVASSILFSQLFYLARELNFKAFVENESHVSPFAFYLPTIILIFYIVTLAEGARHPFDLPEAEAELVAGYNVEYSAIWFALFFLGEYLNVIFNAILINDIFFGQSDIVSYSIGRILIIIFITIFIRSLIPRYRYDQLMSLNWKILLPILSASVIYLLYLEHYQI